jgi:hypothetical protein
MKSWIYLLLSLLLGIICAGCAQNRLTIVAKSVQSTDVGDIDFEVQYNVFSHTD